MLNPLCVAGSGPDRSLGSGDARLSRQRLVINADDYRDAWQSSDASALRIDLAPGTDPLRGMQLLKQTLVAGSGLNVETAGERERRQRETARQGLTSDADRLPRPRRHRLHHRRHRQQQSRTRPTPHSIPRPLTERPPPDDRERNVATSLGPEERIASPEASGPSPLSSTASKAGPNAAAESRRGHCRTACADHAQAQRAEAVVKRNRRVAWPGGDVDWVRTTTASVGEDLNVRSATTSDG
ncbi:MAG TPA: hypothetical protein VFF79_08655 [Conexibacter sp.]|nr:hypothetical protein [Conexibacter sp.]